MTDRSQWTDDRINEAIAKAKGWVYYKPTKTWGRRETADQIHGSLPDYTHDWRFAGELLEEMMAYMPVEIGNIKGGFMVSWACCREVRSKSLLRAICGAWLEWKESQSD